MADTSPEIQEAGTIIYHFDVKSHSIPAWQYKQNLDATKKILDSFNKNFFDGKLKFEIHVYGSKEGGLLETLGITVVGGLAFIKLTLEVVEKLIKIAESETGKAILKRWFGKTLEELIEGDNSFSDDDDDDSDSGGDSNLPFDDSGTSPEPDDSRKKRISEDKLKVSPAEVEKIIASCIKYFLMNNNNELIKAGLSIEEYREAYEGKNQFYKASQKNKEVEAIGFDRSESFSIKKEKFKGMIKKLPKKDEGDWVIEDAEIEANSPNWDKKGRKWQGKIRKSEVTINGKSINDRTVNFSVEDLEFWRLIDRRDDEIEAEIRDNMKVQWCRLLKKGMIRCIVLKVLEFNGKHIADPYTPEQLKQYFEQLKNRDGITGQLIDNE